MDLNSLEEITGENKYSRELLDGSYIDYLHIWFDKFNQENIKIIFFDELKDNPKQIVDSLCQWLEIDREFFKDTIFTIENKSVVFKNQLLQKWAMNISLKIEPLIRNNFKIKRSEEHTSELQSRRNLVCRLLLEKKK